MRISALQSPRSVREFSSPKFHSFEEITMKNTLFVIGKELSLAFLAVAVAGTLHAVIGKAFIWPEGGIVASIAIWYVLHKVTQPVEHLRIGDVETTRSGGNLRRLAHDESGQDIAEYAVMLAVILVIVVGTIKLIGGNANNVFSSVASSISAPSSN